MVKKMKNISLFLLLFTVLVVISVALDSKKIDAAGIFEASDYIIGTDRNAALTQNGADKQYYKFTLNESGKISITGQAYMQWMYMYIYDDTAKELWKINPNWNSTSEIITISEDIYLTSGTYYFCIGKDGERCGNYKFKIDFISSNENFKEINGGSNNNIKSASTILTNGTYYNAQIAINDDKDFWKIELPSSGKISITGQANMEWVYMHIYDDMAEELWKTNPHWNDTSKIITISEEIYLTSGTYYFCVEKDGERCGDYNFAISFVSSNETFAEINGGSNNTVASASELKIENAYIGMLGLNDEKDFYRFTVDSNGSYVVSIKSSIKYMYMNIFSADNIEIVSRSISGDSTTGNILYSEIISLERGTNYIALSRDGNNFGNYTLSVSKITQDNCPHKEYTSEWHDDTYFSKGFREYTCEECGYSYRSDYEVKRKLYKGMIYSSSKAGKGSLLIYWDDITDATGYQIRYSKNKAMTNGVKVKSINDSSKRYATIKSLTRKKNYYVQVRGYIRSGTNIAYGAWSDKYKIKTK